MTINEIAKLAGVSRATVSRYLNTGYVSEEKRKRIKKIVEEQSYVPSKQAQNLRTKKTGLIGVVIPKINSDSVSLLVSGITSELSKSKYRIILGDTENNEKEEVEFLQMFKSNYVDGIILLGSIFTKGHFKAMKELNVPIVIAGQNIEKYSCVFSDNYKYIKEMALSMGMKSQKLGYIGVTEEDKAVGFERKQGYLDACEELKKEIVIEQGEFSIKSGYEAMKKLMERNVDGVLCATDSLAIGAIKYLKEIKYEIPKKIIVAGVGNSRLCEFIDPELTTIDMNYKDIGIESARLIMEMISDKKNVEKKIIISSNIINRKSTERE